MDPGMETPLNVLAETEAPAPAPTRRRAGAAPAKPRKRGRDKAAGAPTSRGPLGAGLAYVGASWRVLLFVVGVQLLLGLTVIVPFYSAASERLDHHPHASSLAGSPTAYDGTLSAWAEGGLNAGIWRDLKREEASLFKGLGVTFFWVAIVAWLFGALAAGGFLGTAVSGEDPVRVGAFLTHGARLYGPMLRVGLCFALAYYLVARLVLEAWGGSVASTEFMDSSEAAGFWGARLREGVVVICFFWLRMAADLARTRMALLGTRGAVGAFLRGLGGALRPRVWLAALAFGLPTYGLLLCLGLGAQELTGDDPWVLVGLFLVFQIAVFLRWAGRAAVLAAFAKLS